MIFVIVYKIKIIKMSKIIVVDDTRAIRNVLKELLDLNGHDVDVASSAEEGLVLIRENSYDLVISDIMLTGISGIELLRIVKQELPELPFIIISGHASVSVAVDVIKEGAVHVLEKPLDMNMLLTQIKFALDNKVTAVANEAVRKPQRQPKVKIGEDSGSPMIGECKNMLRIKDMINVTSLSNARVLILGANGTGKELVAREIHRLSNRANKAFVEINCAAIPSELIESELFGHEKGSFTGAYKQKKGKFELADKGTIFLDEIGDMSLSAQSKVLRALQENRITHVGGDKDIEVDVKVVAATNKNLVKEIEAGRFREDLYHRLSVVIIRVPSLNDRVEDIPLLAKFFLKKLCTSYGIGLKTFSDDAMKMLMSHNWSGNVRELSNIVERLVVFSGDEININDIRTYVDEEYDRLG